MKTDGIGEKSKNWKQEKGERRRKLIQGMNQCYVTLLLRKYISASSTRKGFRATICILFEEFTEWKSKD